MARIELRDFKDLKSLVIIFEGKEESAIVDEVFGSTVKQSDGFIANVQGEVRLSDGYADHYIFLYKPPFVPLKIEEPKSSWEYAQQFMQDPSPERDHEDNSSSDVHGDSKDRS